VVGILAALVLAAVGTVALVAFVRGAEERATAGEDLVSVLVVKAAIPAGTSADSISSAVGEEQIPKKVVVDGAVNDLGQLTGLVSSVSLVVGEQVTAGRFVTPAQYKPSGTAVEVPPGLLQVTVQLDPSATVGGILQPGDTVAVVGTIDSGGGPATHLILHKVLVSNVQGAPLPTATLEVDSTTSDRAAAPDGELLITLATDPVAVERIVHLVEQGTIYLALEKADVSNAPTQPQTNGSVLE
jgi:pilus assembly protein CpaB